MLIFCMKSTVKQNIIKNIFISILWINKSYNDLFRIITDINVQIVNFLGGFTERRTTNKILW
ncbi:MAG: hypothetical protein K0S47_336 [Herbinix sp.]|nr:hypothetical protein [Herbinix sp.]